MARDYAKKKGPAKKGGASRSKKKQKKPIGLIFFAFLLFSGLAALLVYLKWYQPRVEQKTSVVSKPIKTTTKKINITNNQQSNTNISKQATEDEVPFYRTHQEMMNKTVEIPIEDLKLPEDDHQYSYSMPCGSFREKSRAEELKAQIAFAGYESNVLPIKNKAEWWYRVTLGPYTSKRKTESIRHRLQDNGFNHCKIWRKLIK